jgi:hypothetical protein
MTVTDLDQLEHEHPALLAMHQRMKEEAVTLSARVAELERHLLFRHHAEIETDRTWFGKLTAADEELATAKARIAELETVENARLREVLVKLRRFTFGTSGAAIIDDALAATDQPKDGKS